MMIEPCYVFLWTYYSSAFDRVNAKSIPKKTPTLFWNTTTTRESMIRRYFPPWLKEVKQGSCKWQILNNDMDSSDHFILGSKCWRKYVYREPLSPNFFSLKLLSSVHTHHIFIQSISCLLIGRKNAYFWDSYYGNIYVPLFVRADGLQLIYLRKFVIKPAFLTIPARISFAR